MREYQEVELGGIMTTLKGNAFKSSLYVKEGTPIVRASNFTSDSISTDDLLYYSDDEAGKFHKYKLRHKDILIQTVGSWQSNPASIVGKVVRVPKQLENALLNQNIVKIVPLENVDSDFLFYRLKDESFKFYNLSTAQGAANQASITLGSIRKFKIALPNFDVQQKIGYILSQYDDLIENNLKRIKLLEELAQRTYEEWFVKFRVNGVQLEVGQNGLPEGWERKMLVDIAEISNGFAFKANQFNTDKKGMPIIRIRNIPNSNTNDFTTEKVNDKFLVKKGDLLVGMDGEFYINNWSGPKAFLVQRSCNIKAVDKFYHGYLSQAIVKPIKYFEATISGATVAHLGKKHLDTIEIVIPPKEIDNYINKFNDWLNLKINLGIENRLLKESRDILLPRLMSGKIEVQKVKEQLETLTIPIQKAKIKEASKEFKEAVLISVLTERFGSEKYPLGRKRYTKLSYLFHRHADNQIADYLRKAAGPYNPKTKYAGPEKIAHQNGYVVDHKNGNLTGFIAGQNIVVAKGYFEKYWSNDYMNWLESQFKYKSNDELELYATVDSTMIELYKNDLPVTVENVKGIIKKELEWKAKLEREIFSDGNIGRAIGFLPTIFNY
ncbi:restriction endonuclease subunit S [Flavobacterium pallidum]|uniref:Type I restriction modification DNA specificity domain-containing protein n=1 Tax=Flavobacterium pallidum TaxID=2172098 RepID=A0A2S1SHF6_9FLAO|nr:restriction endonuclease subunit S [Flavobacterium pallidum]AWI25799.1 hypothetical protein HYN49_07725 [Flavobacterium pallidum]